MNSGRHKVEFIPSGRGKAQCPPDPAFPNGVDVDGRLNDLDKYCIVELPYPAPECGLHRVECMECKMVTVVTAAGRPDDPKSVKLSCLTGKI